MEEWKDVIGYEGLYQVSNLGNIKSFKIDKKEGKIMKLKVDKDGYLQIGIRDKYGTRSFFRVHRLVAFAFIDNPNNHYYVNHKDCNVSNNNVENLEWCTVEYNNKYRFTHGNANYKGENGANSSITNEQAREIRKFWNTSQYERKDLANMFDTTVSVICGVVNNRTYVDDTYIKTYNGRLNYTGVKNKSAKLNEDDVKEIRRLYNENIMNMPQLAKMYNIDKRHVGNIIHLKSGKMLYN